MNIFRKLALLSIIFFTTKATSAVGAHSTEFFCNDSVGWIRFIHETSESKFSFGKFDEAIVDVSLPKHSVKMFEDPYKYFYLEPQS